MPTSRMNKLITVGLLFFSNSAIAQTTTTKEAIAIGDSIVKSKIGNRLFQYFSLSEGTYYTYDIKHQSQRTGKFLNKRKLPKSFATLNLLYHFDYPQIKGVKGGLWLILDKDFKLADTLNFDFIPQFVIKNKPSQFISEDTALAIATRNFKQKGFEISTPDLSYDKNSKQYRYTVTNKLTKVLNQAGKDSGEMEIIEINAVTGKIEHSDKGYYGLIIR
jgi:hypothetical protein